MKYKTKPTSSTLTKSTIFACALYSVFNFLLPSQNILANDVDQLYFDNQVNSKYTTFSAGFWQTYDNIRYFNEPDKGNFLKFTHTSHEPNLLVGTNQPSLDTWELIRRNFSFPNLDSEIRKKYENLFSKSQKQLTLSLQFASFYLPYITQEVIQRGLPSEIALLPYVESTFNPSAISPAGAEGLWQIMPATGQELGLKFNSWINQRKDIITSTNAALDYLQTLYEAFDKNWPLAVAAYNAGESRIKKAIDKNKKLGKPTQFSDLHLNIETRHYLPKLIALRNIVRHPKRFGVKLPPLSNEPYFVEVDFDFQVDLRKVAQASNISDYELALLNPGFRQTLTSPFGPHRVLVPRDKLTSVMKWKDKLLPEEAVIFAHYEVQPGDYLGKIADQYNVSVTSIMSVNSLKSDLISIGKVLLIPTSTSSYSEYAQNFIYSGEQTVRLLYKVKSGDTLWDIAARYKVKIANLIKWNDIDGQTYIHPGQKLVVYTKN